MMISFIKIWQEFNRIFLSLSPTHTFTRRRSLSRFSYATKELSTKPTSCRFFSTHQLLASAFYRYSFQMRFEMAIVQTVHVSDNMLIDFDMYCRAISICSMLKALQECIISSLHTKSLLPALICRFFSSLIRVFIITMASTV
ncbi:unnamed protein product [Albugo candida]|uniref:Uncharacterized protein n=1 Tax=Albugo candida TaxID=65357 RepID=A0A024GB63_9STRA|nr:unnamed protein product [Albugo candida]|eukprot:CCI43998.1 unnamed protein product [Albugo candida]